MSMEREQILDYIEKFAKNNHSAGEYGIPRRHLVAMRQIRTIKPGIDSEILKACIGGLDHLVEGNIIMLAGKYGCGKTFAACCLVPLYLTAKRIIRMAIEDKYEVEHGYEDEGYTRITTGVSRSSDWAFTTSHHILKVAFDDSNDLFTTSDLVIVDDIGWEHFTDKGFGISEWDRFFDSRYRGMRPTILTTNLTAVEFQNRYTKRIYDRLRESAIWFESAGESLRRKPEGLI